MDDKHKSAVETLVQKAADAVGAPEAVNFAQAACNAANALRVLDEIERASKTE